MQYLVQPSNTSAGKEGGREAGRERERERGGREGGRELRRERERERVMIAVMNTSSANLLARVVLALYYVFHAIRDGVHRELTVLHKLPSPCRAELL